MKIKTFINQKRTKIIFSFKYLRVGRAITPPDTKNTGPPLYSMLSMPTAAAVAAAAATAKIQAIDAVATNLGLNSDILSSKVSYRLHCYHFHTNNFSYDFWPSSFFKVF